MEKGWDYNTVTGDKNYSSAKEDLLGLAVCWLVL
jgi:hypothetical protein